MSDLGIGDDSLVVAYDRTGGLYALRLMWALHYYGHTNVKMLDGGYQKWVSEGRNHDTVPYESGNTVAFTPREPNRAIYAGIEDVLEAIDADDTTLLDVRTDGEWDGSNKRGGKRGGRVPGAIHLEWVNFHTGGEIPVLKTADEIRALLAEKGVSVDGNVITYCQGGIRAAQAFWVLKLVGADSVRNYDASWREWGNNVSVPVEAET
ncbi:MAG: sulfurtransferase [Chloroflexi bacterium]|nr:sulfurtransferase [Chloroflexota bacterium]